MGHRLSKITTRTGDAGETGLGDGSRVPKDSPRVRALGDIDELNSAIGVLLAEELPPELREALGEIQHDLFDLGGELSIPGHALLGDAHVARLEERLEAWNAGLPPRRAQRGRARTKRQNQRARAPLPESPVRSAVRRRADSQSPRRAQRRAVAPRAQEKVE